MRGRVRRFGGAGAVAVLGSLVGWFSLAQATVMVEVPLAQLAQEADAVVQARVERAGPYLGVQDGHIEPYTGIVLRVETWFRGRGPSEIRLRERGGVFPDGSTLQILGTPTYAAGERVVVFLQRRADGAWRTHQMIQGKFEILEPVGGGITTVRRDLREVTLVDETGYPQPGSRQDLPLSHLLEVVRGPIPTAEPPGVIAR